MTGVPQVQSYGGGVQSRALLRLWLEGFMAPPSHVLFADTHVEPEAVYVAVSEDRALSESFGVPFHVVSAGDLRAKAWGAIEIPAHTANERSRGMLRRQCTGKFKIAPMRRHLRQLGYSEVVSWLGITTDEAHRMKPSDVKWNHNRWPLIELGYSRSWCEAFLNERGIPVVKSACVFCPYRGRAEWAAVRSNERDWVVAVEYDRSIRDQRPKGGQTFVHRECVPLDRADVPDVAGMSPLFGDVDLWGNECAGVCGV